jgi:hypothetical protein
MAEYIFVKRQITKPEKAEESTEHLAMLRHRGEPQPLKGMEMVTPDALHTGQSSRVAGKLSRQTVRPG